MAQGTIAGNILKMLVGALASAGGGGAGRILGGILPSAGGARGLSPDTLLDYPDRTSRFDYDVTLVPIARDGNGKAVPTFNQEYKAYPYPKPARMQTLEEHNRALNRYIRPGQSPMERRWAIEKGREEERKLESFWVDDTHSRDPKSKASSSAVSGIHILPNGDIEVQFRGGGKWYTYNGGSNPYDAALEAHDLFMSHSIGQNMNRRGNPSSWAARHAKW